MKKRLDLLMVEKGLADNRDKAKALVMTGNVYVNGVKADISSENVPETAEIILRGGEIPYVSRGGLKLEKAVKAFDISLSGKICMDVGASTGGFTDCMLQNGAAKVYAVDVGYGQLAWKLRSDSRVAVMERTNIRGVTLQNAEPLDFASIDVSFISLTLVLPVVNALLKDNGRIICLIKPQFEAEKEKVGKNGVVRELETHIEVINKIYDFSCASGICPAGLEFSPVKGPQGNIEYLMLLDKSGRDPLFNAEYAADIVKKSHEEL